MERKPRQPNYKIGQRSSSLRKSSKEESKVVLKVDAKPAQIGKRLNVLPPITKPTVSQNKAAQALDKSIEISKIQDNIQRNNNVKII